LQSSYRRKKEIGAKSLDSSNNIRFRSRKLDAEKKVVEKRNAIISTGEKLNPDNVKANKLKICTKGDAVGSQKDS
jgi:hypothetical protein